MGEEVEEVEEAGGELSDRAAVDLPAAPLGAFSLCAVHKGGCCYHVTDSESPFRMKKKVQIKLEFIRQDGYICNLIFTASASQMLERVVKIDHFFDI